MIDFLVVEDSDIKFSDIEALIKNISAKFYIKRVDNVSDATKEIKRRQYSFVLVDIQLPNEKDTKEVNSNAGIELIRWIKHNQTKKKCKPPENILILSEYKNLIEENYRNMIKTQVFLYLYESQSDEWKTNIKECIEEFILKKEAAVSKSSDELIVYSVHGINTYGEWQKSFDEFLKGLADVSIKHFPYKYQYFPIYSFLIPYLRSHEVNRMITDLEYCARKAPNSTVHLVGHSFGTYVICEALKKISYENSPRIGSIILVNSVLKSSYDFSEIVNKHKVERILNECAINDRILVMSQTFALGLGMGGRMGIKGGLYNTVRNRFFKGGHSDLFGSEKFTNWFDFINNKEITYTNERKKTNSIINSILIASPYLIFFLITSLLIWLSKVY